MIRYLQMLMWIKNRFLRFVLILGLVLPFGVIFATVFALSDELAMGVVSAKEYWFYGAMGVCGVTTTIYLALGKQFKIRFTLSELLLLLFTLVGLLPFLRGAEAVNTKFVLLLLLTVLYFYFRIVLSANKFYRYSLYLIILFTAFAEAVWGLRQLYGFLPSQHNQFLLTGSFFNPGPFAGYLAVITPLVFYYLLSDYKVWNRKFNRKYLLFYVRWVFSASTLLAILLVLPATMSRASWLAAVGGCSFAGVMFLSAKYKLKTYIRQHKQITSVYAALLVLLLIVGGVAMYRMKKDSADGRALIWKNSLMAMKENPMGVSLGNFAGTYGKAQALYFETGLASEQEKTVAGNPEYAFNEYLQLGLETGIVGLLLFLSMVVVAIAKGIKLRNYGAVGALCALLIFASMSYPFSMLPFLIVFVFLLADVVNCNGSTLNSNGRITVANRTLANSILIVNLLVVAFCLNNRYPAYKAYKDWNMAKALYNMQMYAETKDGYIRLAPYLSDRVEFLFEYGQVLSKTGEYRKSTEVLSLATRISCDPMLYNVIGKNHQALKNYEAAEQNFLMATNIVPNRMYPYYLLAKLYNETGDRKQFYEAVNQVLQKEPKVHSPAIDEMREEVRKIFEREQSELSQN
jgi:O-antigen ligase